MGIDFVKEFANLKAAYERERGATAPRGIKNPSNGQPLIPPGKAVPNTNWGDVILVFNHLHNIAEGGFAACVQMGGNSSECFSAGVFPQTSSWLKAKSAFDNQNPYLRGAQLAGSPGNMVAGGSYAASHLSQTYPYNEEFWGYAQQYVIARSAAGSVPVWAEIQIESIQHAISNLPSNVQQALETAYDKIPNVLPAFNWIAAMVKWGSIGGGLLLLWWYVLRPMGQGNDAKA